MSKAAWAGGCLAATLSAAMMFASPAQALVRGKPVHGLALYGAVQLGPNDGFAYVNPNAPKGGTLRLEASTPTFDTFNAFSVKGVPASGLVYLGTNGIFTEGLTVSGEDESFAQYCLLCETMEVAEDNSWIEYVLRPEARFHDGSSVTADDVIFSFNTLMEKGQPSYKLYWGDVSKVEKTGSLKVKFHFKTTTNSELPLILGQVPVLSRKFWETHNIAESTLDTPISTGPYRIDSFEAGRFVVYKRDPNYWGKDIPRIKGTYNFDEIRFEYFRDETVSFEAFKSGTFDIHYENTARRWVTGYDFPATKDGRVAKLEVPVGIPMAAQGFIYNSRIPKFADRRVRQALNFAFDFDSMNKTIFYNQYTRLRSYWQRTDLEAKGLPSTDELRLLEPLRDQIPPEVFTQEFAQPTTAGDGNTRENLIKARDLLTEAGWDVVNGQLVNRQTKEPFTFELITMSPTTERVALPWFQNLEKLGIKATLRTVDASQMVNRVSEYDFEVIMSGLLNSLSPGNEQDEYWGSSAADRPGSRNYVGVKNPAIDALVKTMLTAPARDALATAAHALDRVLTWNYYYTLQYGPATDRYAYWTRLQRPEKFPTQGLTVPVQMAALWWDGPAMAQTPTPSGEAAAPAPEPSGSNTWLIALAVLAAAIVGFSVLRRSRS
jgi:microcin C transport system substrate-binding protein